jgi:hypothetical protein
MPRFLRTAALLAAVSGAPGSLGQARAQVAFTSFNGAGRGAAYWMQLPGTTFGPNRVAWRFTAALGGRVAEISIGARRGSGSGAGDSLQIFEANGTEVGPMLGAVAVVLPLGSSVPTAPLTVPVEGPMIELVAGREYFLGLSLESSTLAFWNLFGPSVAGPQAYAIGSDPWQYESPDPPYAGFSITVAPVCYPNCDSSTLPPILNVLDFNCFLNSFAAGASYANCDGSTTAPALNVLDFNCFLNAFAGGCP